MSTHVLLYPFDDASGASAVAAALYESRRNFGKLAFSAVGSDPHQGNYSLSTNLWGTPANTKYYVMGHCSPGANTISSLDKTENISADDLASWVKNKVQIPTSSITQLPTTSSIPVLPTVAESE